MRHTLKSSMTAPSSSRYYISITGLEVASFWMFPRFMSLTIPARQQARVAPGNVQADTNRIDGIMHTLTAWNSREDMLKYVRSGAHLEAMKNIKKIASYAKTYSYESDTIPTWAEARKLWEENGRIYMGEPKEFDLKMIERLKKESEEKQGEVDARGNAQSAVAVSATS
jgi:CMP-N-acetylneuraminic acid synthetase